MVQRLTIDELGELTPAELDQLVADCSLAEMALSTMAVAEWRDPEREDVPWQHELADECDAIIDSALAGTGRRVTLSAPPRHGKTEFVGRALPVRAYLAAAQRGEKMSIFYVTSGDDRAVEVSQRVRRSIEQLYEETGDEQWAPGPLWKTTEWETKGGHQWVGKGWKGATGGIGCRILIMDDLIGTSQNYRSKATRMAIRRVVQEDMLSRLMKGGAAIQMETRRGPDDTTAWLQREFGDTWVDRVWACWDAVRGYLWPEQYGAEWRKTMPHLTDTSPIWRALYQQEPVAEGGTLIPMEWLMATYRESPEVAAARADKVVIGADLTNTKKTTSDEASFTVTAHRGAYRDILKVRCGHFGYVEQRQILRDEVNYWAKHATGPVEVVVELAAGGDQMVEELQGEIPNLRGERPRGDKVMRLTPHLPRFAAGQVRTPATQPAWVTPWREEHAAFSGIEGEPDNRVDSGVWSFSETASPPRPSAQEVQKTVAAVFGGWR